MRLRSLESLCRPDTTPAADTARSLLSIRSSQTPPCNNSSLDHRLQFWRPTFDVAAAMHGPQGRVLLRWASARRRWLRVRCRLRASLRRFALLRLPRRGRRLSRWAWARHGRLCLTGSRALPRRVQRRRARQRRWRCGRRVRGRSRGSARGRGQGRGTNGQGCRLALDRRYGQPVAGV